MGLDSQAQVLLYSELFQYCRRDGCRHPPCELLQVSASAGRGLQRGRALWGAGPEDKYSCLATGPACRPVYKQV